MRERDIQWHTQLVPFAVQAIHDYCERRNYRCRGCPYSPAKLGREPDGVACCIFANCPCSWDVKAPERREA